jgi:hypothetical protein
MLKTNNREFDAVLWKAMLRHPSPSLCGTTKRKRITCTQWPAGTKNRLKARARNTKPNTTETPIRKKTRKHRKIKRQTLLHKLGIQMRRNVARPTPHIPSLKIVLLIPRRQLTPRGSAVLGEERVLLRIPPR